MEITHLPGPRARRPIKQAEAQIDEGVNRQVDLVLPQKDGVCEVLVAGDVLLARRALKGSVSKDQSRASFHDEGRPTENLECLSHNLHTARPDSVATRRGTPSSRCTARVASCGSLPRRSAGRPWLREGRQGGRACGLGRMVISLQLVK